jgi:2,3-bisphosphoglycerate-independent phosphoglycerate mutase
VIGEYLPRDQALREMMKKSYDILNHHPLNEARKAKGLNKANSLWFWGAGTRPALTSFEEKNHLKGAMISAVDLLKGIAVGAGMKVIEVPGANGTLHTNYEGKAMAAVKVLLEENYDFAYIHVEAPDEMGHQGSIPNKIQSIEYLDQRVIKVVMEEMKKAGVDYRMLVMPDHPTPIRCRTHTSDPVPYLLYDSTAEQNNNWHYNEAEAKSSGNVVSDGYTAINKLLAR